MNQTAKWDSFFGFDSPDPLLEPKKKLEKESRKSKDVSYFSGVHVMLVFCLVSASIQTLGHQATMKWRFQQAEIVCSECLEDEQNCDQVLAEPIDFDTEHPWVRALQNRKSTVFPMGPSADVCVIRKNMITQFSMAACKYEYRHLRKHGCPTRNPMFPHLHFHSIHNVCMDNAMRWAAERSGSGSADRPQLALVRDPIDRFVSAYIQTCLSYIHYPEVQLGYTWKQRCLNCEPNDICCFARQLKRGMADRSHVDTFYAMPTEHAVMHVMPQTLSCNANGTHPKFTYVHWKDRKNLGPILTQFTGMPAKFFETGWGLNGREKFLADTLGHETSAVRDTVKQVLFSSQRHVDMLRDFYKSDYKLLKDLGM